VLTATALAVVAAAGPARARAAVATRSSGGATIAVSPSTGAPGDSILVSGSDWAPATQVSVQLCGAGALRGTSDCDMSSSVVVGTSTTGTFGVQLVVSVPPAPCPCVVQVVDITSDESEVLPVDVAGAPSAPLPARPTGVPRHPIRVVEAHLEGASWGSWFGSAARRTLVLEIANVSTRAVEHPSVLVSTGRGGDERSPQRVPRQAPLPPRQVRTIRVPVTFGAPAIGRYGVRVSVGEAGALRTVEVKTSTYPWGFLVFGLLLVQLGLLGLRNRARNRLRAQQALAMYESLDADDRTSVPSGPTSSGNEHDVGRRSHVDA
jgi:hypothetical protein